MNKVYKTIYWIIVFALLIGVYYVATYKEGLGSKNIQKVDTSGIYPNPQFTPGLVATTDFKELTAVSACGTYSQCHRKTTNAMKNIVCNEYPQNCTGTDEKDHVIPLALGGADDIKNLWSQPEHVLINGEDWGFHTKDKLETYLVNQMKAGKISPSDAQHCILSNWIACYKTYLSKNTFGFVVSDPDDEGDLPEVQGKG